MVGRDARVVLTLIACLAMIPAAEAASKQSRWSESGGRNHADHRNPRFRLELSARERVVIDLASADTDAFVYLTTADGASVIGSDDDAGGGGNSRLDVTLDPGRYLLVAATHQSGARGAFSLAASTGTLKRCVIGYEHAWYGGASSVMCGGGDPVRSDFYSSFRVPSGARLRGFEHSNFTGRARTYFQDTPWVGPGYNDLISSVTWGDFDVDDFVMLVASDPQFSWDHCSDDRNSARCQQERAFFGSASEETIGRTYNANLVGAIEWVGDFLGARRLAGVIVNGDLTEFGHQGPDLDDYVDLYERGLDMNVYLGLGNHDYDNNVDDCGGNVCASTMIWYLRDQVRTLNPLAFDYRETGVFYEFPVRKKRHEGSLGYAWDVGNVHFVQLNNYPTYTRAWSGWNWGGAYRDEFEIRSAMAWLRSDVEAAARQGKDIVLNLHDWGAVRGNAELHAILNDFPISAVFAGHWHGTIGEWERKGPFADGRTVPILFSGSAHYGSFLASRFVGGKLYVWVFSVDHYNGAALRVMRGGVARPATDLSKVLAVCDGCERYYEYVYDLR